jgi:branched-chain amino acid transport system substrate-binding protein
MTRKITLGIIGVLFLSTIGFLILHKSVPPSADHEIVVASIIPLTGPGAEFGNYNLQASELFVEDYNRSHKEGRSIRHIFQDSKSTAKDGISALQAILLENRPIAIQAQLSAVSVAIAPSTAEKKILLFSIAGTAAAKSSSSFAFRNYPDPVLTARETANAFLTGKPDARVAVLRINDEFGIAVGSAFNAQLSHMKISLVADESFEKTATDFRTPITKILSRAPTIVYIVGFGNPLGRIMIQLRELGFKGDVLGGPEIAFNDVLETAKDAAEGVRFLDLAFDAGSAQEPAHSFIQRYREKFGRAPTAVSAVVYDGWSLFLLAIERAGSAVASLV